MRHLNESHLLEINNIYPFLNNIKYFVETGTYKGGTLNNLSNFFYELHSIELNNNNFNYCRNQFINNNKIKLYNDDSTNILSSIIKNINSEIVYFLDAHYNSNTNSSKGKYDVNILSELEIIKNNDFRKSIIIINNFRLFGLSKSKETADTDWSEITLNNIINKLDIKNIDKHFLLPSSKLIKKNDKYIIFLKSREHLQHNIVNHVVENVIEESLNKIELSEESLEENLIEENNDIELVNDIEEENKLDDLIFYKNGYFYKDTFKSSLVSQNREYLEQLLKMKDKLSLNVIDKRNINY